MRIEIRDVALSVKMYGYLLHEVDFTYAPDNEIAMLCSL